MNKTWETVQQWRAMTDCSCRGSMSKSQHPHGGSQMSVTPGPGAPVSSSGLYGHQVSRRCTDIGKASIGIK